MASQTKMNGSVRPAPAPEGVMGDIESFGNNLATLVSLQARLASYDLRDSVSQALPHAILLATGLVFALASVPVLLIGASFWLADAWNLKVGVVMVVLAAIVLMLGGVTAYLATGRLGPCFTYFRRSQDELQRNVAWIRTVLSQSGRGR